MTTETGVGRNRGLSMGYHIDFSGEFSLNKKLDGETCNILKKLGCIYKDPEELSLPPSKLNSYCQWVPSSDGMSIKWNDAEKFRDYIEWIEYLIKEILQPKEYVLNGSVYWRGESFDDFGKIEIINNNVKTLTLD
jgi:hypothetical protein